MEHIAKPVKRIMDKITDWQPISTIPRNRDIMVKTVKGQWRIAICRPQCAVNSLTAKCFSRDRATVSDLSAAAWRELTEGEKNAERS